MNNNIDLTKILKDCPKGWKLYTPIFGEVEFSSIEKDCTYPIILSVQEGGSATFTGLVKFTKEGCFFTESTDVECLLFPSKEQRDWSKFTASWYKKLVEPKFKVGDWIISSVLGTARIIGVNDSNEYQLEYIDSKQKFSSIDYVNYAYDKWTIQDAKDGDIIRLGTVTAIFKKYISQEKCICYCSFCKDGGFEIPIENGEDNVYGCYNATPVTKEQCDSFMKVMNDDGYEWDIKKKELNKKKKFNPKTLKPFDKVLVRDKSCYNWMCELFSYIKTESEFKYWCISNGYKYCIPYNDDTKHLVGTTEEAPEYYRYWED